MVVVVVIVVIAMAVEAARACLTYLFVCRQVAAASLARRVTFHQWPGRLWPEDSEVNKKSSRTALPRMPELTGAGAGLDRGQRLPGHSGRRRDGLRS